MSCTLSPMVGVEGLRKKDIIFAVKEKLGEETLKEILNFLESQKPKLWSEQRPSGFAVSVYHLVMYKDLFAVGMGKLRKKVHDWLPMDQKAIQHNSSSCSLRVAKVGINNLGPKHPFFHLWKWPKELNDHHHANLTVYGWIHLILKLKGPTDSSQEVEGKMVLTQT